MLSYLRTNPQNLQLLKGKLKTGEIISARIIKKIDEFRYLVDIKDVEIYAESELNITSNRVFVQIETLNPKIHLRFLPYEDNPRFIEIIDIARKHNLILNETNYSVLDTMIKNKFIHEKNDLKKVIKKIIKLNSRIFEEDIFSLNDFIKIMIKNDNYEEIEFFLENRFWVLNSSANNPIQNFWLLSQHSDCLDLTASLQGDELGRLQKTFIIISEINSLHQEAKLDCVFFSLSGSFYYLLLQNFTDEGTPGKINARINLPHLGEFRIEISYLGKQISLQIFCSNNTARNFFNGFRDNIQKIIVKRGYELVNYQSTFETLKSETIPKYVNLIV